MHVKYFVDRNPPVDPSSTRTSRRPARRSASAGGISSLRYAESTVSHIQIR